MAFAWETAATGLFWTAGGLLVYTYLVFPAALGALARLLGHDALCHDLQPTVTMLLAAHNEAPVMAAKMANCLALDYPPDKLQTVVVSDGSDDGTDEIVAGFADRGVELLHVEPRGGKPNAINHAAQRARGEILVFCDANTMLRPDALRRMVAHFADATVGGVTGDVRLGSDDVVYGQGESAFYRLERFTQRCESRIWTTIGVDGGMYAVRRELFVPNRPDTLVDDFVTGMNVARRGRRVVYEPQAVATEDAVVDPRQEFRRRARTVAGGFQSLFEGLGRPRWNQPGLWLGYLSHKVTRWCGPFLMMLVLVANAALVLGRPREAAGWSMYATLLGVQGVFYVLAAAGWLQARRRLGRVLALPYYFCLANAAALVGFFQWLLRRQAVTWQHADRHGPRGATA